MSASTLHSTLPSESRGELAASWPVQGRPRGHRCRRTESVRTLPKSTRLSGAPLWAALKATGVLKGACSEARREVCHDSDCSVSAHLDVPAYTNTFPHSRRLEQMKTDPSNRVQIPSREHVNVEVQYNLRYNFFSMGQIRSNPTNMVIIDLHSMQCFNFLFKSTETIYSLTRARYLSSGHDSS